MSVIIHPSSVVETDDIGDGTYIGPMCYITKNVKIGENCKFISHCSIGQGPQYKSNAPYRGGIIEIGDNTEIREFVTINLPTEEITFIGKRSYIMANCHIPHDANLAEGTFMVVGASLGGFTKSGKDCYYGINCSTHPFAELGDHCLLGGNTFFKGKSPDGIIWQGVPARPIKVNIVGLERNESNESRRIKIIKEAEQFLLNY